MQSVISFSVGKGEEIWTMNPDELDPGQLSRQRKKSGKDGKFVIFVEEF